MTTEQEMPNESNLAIGDYLQVLEDEPQCSLLLRGDVVRVVRVGPAGFRTDGRGLEWSPDNTSFWGFDYALIGKYFRRLDGLRLPEVRAATELTPGTETQS